MVNTSAPIVLVDGSSYLFRAFHALPPLTNSEGIQTGAIKGVTSMLKKLVESYPNSPIAVIFDAKGPTFRNEMYAEYKANRPPMPEELREQIVPVHDMVVAMGLPLLCIEGVEADDVIGTLAEQATQAGLECVISTGDKDMAQLVSPHVSLLNTMKNEYLNVEGVREKYGFGPELMIDYLALMGDKVDNIPGVPGVGEKTALALIQGLGGLNDIYSRLDEVAQLTFRGAKTMAAKLEAHKEMAYLSYELATIKLDVELDVCVQDIKTNDPDNEQLLALYQRFQFKTWIRELSGETTETAANSASRNTKAASIEDRAEFKSIEPEQTNYTLVASTEELASIKAEIEKTGHLSYVPVWQDGHYNHRELAGLAIASAPGLSWYFPFAADIGTVLDTDSVVQWFKDLIESHAITKTGSDFKSDYHWFNQKGIRPSRLLFDVEVMAFVYDSTCKRDKALATHFSPLSVDNLARLYLEKELKTLDDYLGKPGKKRLPVSAIDPNEIGLWFCERVDFQLRIQQWLGHGLKQRGLAQVYFDIEKPLSPILAAVERNGVVLDTDYMNQVSADFKSRLASLEQKAHDLAGTAFNIDSPKQLAEILFTKLELPVVKKTASGAPSTNEEVLKELAESHELPRLILESRHLRKLVGTYTDPLPTMVQQDENNDYRLHTSYHQTGAQTGRMSSHDPNLQNIPIRSEEGRSIRQAFIAPKGYKLLAADYSQIELRIMTHLSQDENLVTAFKEGRDIHRATAAEVMGVAEEDVTTEQRRSAKAINFGLIYGMSAFGLANQLGISRTEAKKYVEAYFERYPGVKRYMDETQAEASETGYVETIYGRRLYLPGIQSSNQMVRKGAERTAINAPMQGSAADIIKMAMVDVQKWLEGSPLRARMIMQVHDELVFEVHEDDFAELSSGVRFRMQHCAQLDVPLIVDIGVGNNWDEAH
ncbi:DNA polymerase I [Reinekea marina]|uniref:DNA polymerase I n=1 Tax=Reinekea marina TaxID=1310421 RepID=A0ABV7WRL0_9GAMM|nr:DNA polymerase I [Reinekea marina]MDN3650669.1 DNA polymerase I [Reinekea marina]